MRFGEPNRGRFFGAGAVRKSHAGVPCQSLDNRVVIEGYKDISSLDLLDQQFPERVVCRFWECFRDLIQSAPVEFQQGTSL